MCVLRLLQKDYKCYHPPTRKHYVTMDVTFLDEYSYFDSTYHQGENILRLEDKWDWDVEEESEKGKKKLH